MNNNNKNEYYLTFQRIGHGLMTEEQQLQTEFPKLKPKQTKPG